MYALRLAAAAAAVQAVALRPDVAGVVADSAYESGPAIVAEAGPDETGLPDWYAGAIVLAARVLFGLDAHAVDPAAVVRAHPDVPFLFVHCEGDTLIRPHHARARSATRAPIRAAASGSRRGAGTWARRCATRRTTARR